MDDGSRLQCRIDEVASDLKDSRGRISILKKALTAEETRAIELKLTKDFLEERLRRYKASLPTTQEKEQAGKEIDEEFLRKLPSLMEKV